MNVITNSLQILLGLVFLVSGGMKLFQIGYPTKDLDRLRLPKWQQFITGEVEMLGGVGMLVGLRNPVLALLSGLWLAATMVGAVFTRLRRGNPSRRYRLLPAILFLVLSLAVVALCRLELDRLRGQGV